MRIRPTLLTLVKVATGVLLVTVRAHLACLFGVEPKASTCCTTAGGQGTPTLCDPEQQQGEANSLDCFTMTPRSPAGNFLKRHLVVPKLHLPVPVTPAPSSASRLSLESSALAAGNTTGRCVGDAPLVKPAAAAGNQPPPDTAAIALSAG